MEPLLQQLRELPARFMAMSPGLRWGLVGGAVLIAAVALVASTQNKGEAYAYAFTNLSPEDSAEASTLLRNSHFPFRLEANGAALAVPQDKVYDARLLLAAAGLPRGGGVGFELFDRGDLGVSEFTQKVNLQRAIEGELQRTMERLAEVRSARAHITLAERGLYRDDDRAASAAVVLNLKSTLPPNERELNGIRHLVAAAVPGLAAERVTIVDGRGSVLVAEGGDNDGLRAKERQMARELERQVVSLLEPAVGAGAVIARVNVQLDESEVSTNAEVVDPEGTAVRSERHVTTSASNSSQNGPANTGVAGAAGNQAQNAAGSAQNQTQSQTSGSTSSDDQTRNYDVSRTTTVTRVRGPRVKKLTVAILLDGENGKARAAADVARLGELAKRAVGFDKARQDDFQISSEPFARAGEDAAAQAAADAAAKGRSPVALIGVGIGLLLLLGVFLGVRALRNRTAKNELELLSPGARIGEIETRLGGGDLAGIPGGALAAGGLARAALVDPATAIRDRAREAAQADPVRAAALLRAWIEADADPAAPNAVRSANG